jgi:hypothetical protein
MACTRPSRHCSNSSSAGAADNTESDYGFGTDFAEAFMKFEFMF